MANDSTSEQRAALPVIITFTSDEMLALKELVVEKRRGFWRIYSLLISLCAFMLSLITAVISAYVSYKKDIHDQLGELPTAIGSLRELHLKQQELVDKRPGDNPGDLAYK